MNDCIVTLRSSTLREEWSLPIFPSTSSVGLLFLLVATVLLDSVCGLVRSFLAFLIVGFSAVGIAAVCGCNVPALMETLKYHPIILYGGKFFMSYALGLSLHLRSETSCRRCRDVVIVVLRLLSGKAHLEEHSEQFSVDHFRCVGFLPVLDRGQASRSEG